MQRVCVFCGSKAGVLPGYAEAARQLGRLLAQAHRTIVYGGGGIGLMGALADAALAAGGQVIGVIPHDLVARELAHIQLTELRVVKSMHERKATMAELSDGFVVLPGGAGTMEEFFEIWSWSQLGIYQKPCGILNVLDYYTPLLAFLDQMVEQGFLSAENRATVLVETTAERLLARLDTYRAPPATRASLDQSET